MGYPAAILITLLLSLSPLHGAITRAVKSTGEYQSKTPQHFGFAPPTFTEIHSNKIQFEEEDQDSKAAQSVRFEDDSTQEQTSNLVFPKPGLEEVYPQVPDQIRVSEEKVTRSPIKKRRRRKKARHHVPAYPQVYIPTALPHSNHGVNQGLQAYKQYRPRPQISVAGAALDSIIDALTSVARHDDLQCVSRMLCEAASGKAPVDGSGFLHSIMDIQPLITLLALYNGVTSSPLFVFGRAIFLGMTSSEKSGACQQAFPLCPTDTEKLIEYLNNHKGGFFRFFKGGVARPEFINPQLANQLGNTVNPGSYGLLHSNLPYPQHHNPSYGFGQDSPEIYKSFEASNIYALPNTDGSEANIEDRILNVPDKNNVDNVDEVATKLHQDYDFGNLHHVIRKYKFRERLMVSKKIKFPGLDVTKKTSPFNFPDQQINGNNKDYPSPYNHGHEGEDLKRFYGSVPSNAGGEVEFVYILRGNQDPSRPDVVKLKTGEKVS